MARSWNCRDFSIEVAPKSRGKKLSRQLVVWVWSILWQQKKEKKAKSEMIDNWGLKMPIPTGHLIDRHRNFPPPVQSIIWGKIIFTFLTPDKMKKTFRGCIDLYLSYLFALYSPNFYLLTEKPIYSKDYRLQKPWVRDLSFSIISFGSQFRNIDSFMVSLVKCKQVPI